MVSRLSASTSSFAATVEVSGKFRLPINGGGIGRFKVAICDLKAHRTFRVSPIERRRCMNKPSRADVSEQALSVMDNLRIFEIRGQAVMLDSDLAAVYGVETKQLNRAVRRNEDRFPADFTYLLRGQELANLKFQFGTSSSHGGRRKLPRVFTEHGAIMAATVLSSPRAVAMSAARLRRSYWALLRAVASAAVGVASLLWRTP